MKYPCHKLNYQFRNNQVQYDFISITMLESNSRLCCRKAEHRESRETNHSANILRFEITKLKISINMLVTVSKNTKQNRVDSMPKQHPPCTNNYISSDLYFKFIMNTAE